MPFSPNLRADYIELINTQLDMMPVQSAAEFEMVIEALNNFPDISQTVLPDHLQERMVELKDCYDTPEDYVQDEQNYSEFQGIIKSCVGRKRDEFTALSDVQKEAYTQAQQEAHARGLEARERMASREPPEPGSRAHTDSDERWFAFLQLRENTRSLSEALERLRLESVNADTVSAESDLNVNSAPNEYRVDMCAFTYDAAHNQVTVLVDVEEQSIDELLSNLTDRSYSSFTSENLSNRQVCIKIESDCPADLMQDLYRLQSVLNDFFCRDVLSENALDNLMTRFEINTPPPFSM